MDHVQFAVALTSLFLFFFWSVAVKSMDAGMSPAERLAKAKAKEKERLAEISIEAYERGIKKRRRKRKKKESTADEEKAASKK
jgi:uncharacterized membrane protein